MLRSDTQNLVLLLDLDYLNSTFWKNSTHATESDSVLLNRLYVPNIPEQSNCGWGLCGLTPSLLEFYQQAVG